MRAREGRLPAPEAASGRPPRARLLSAVMLGVASGAVLVPLNTTMLAVALPGVMLEFNLGAQTVTSLVTLYLGVVAIALPVAGSLGDRFGPRNVFLSGVLGFGAASLIAAFASSFEILELARVCQAVSGALVSTSSATLIRETAPPDRRGEAFGLFDLLTSVSAAVGPFLGGVIVGALGWRALFFLAAPIAIGAAVVVAAVLKRPRGYAEGDETADPARDPTLHRARPRASLDVPGLVLLGITIAAFLVALRATDAPALGLIAGVAVIPLLAAFLVVELRSERPAVDPHLLRQSAFAAALAGVFGATIVLHGTFILVPLLVERLSALQVLGGALVLGGIYVVNRVPRMPAVSPEPLLE